MQFFDGKKYEFHFFISLFSGISCSPYSTPFHWCATPPIAPLTGNTKKQGNWKKEIQLFLSKTHIVDKFWHFCSHLWSDWLFTKTCWHTIIFYRKKLNIHFLNSLIFGYCPKKVNGLTFITGVFHLEHGRWAREAAQMGEVRVEIQGALLLSVTSANTGGSRFVRIWIYNLNSCLIRSPLNPISAMLIFQSTHLGPIHTGRDARSEAN